MGMDDDDDDDDSNDGATLPPFKTALVASVSHSFESFDDNTAYRPWQG